jgi:kumamolisin
VTSRLKLVGLVAVPALLAAAVPSAYAAAQPHTTRAAIAGDVLKGLNHDAARTGAVSAAKRISVAISLTPRNDKGSTPSSPTSVIRGRVPTATI